MPKTLYAVKSHPDTYKDYIKVARGDDLLIGMYIDNVIPIGKDGPSLHDVSAPS